MSADNLAYRLLNLYPSVPPCTQYVKNADQYTAGYISPEDFSYLYTGERQKLPEWDKIEEFRIIMSNSTSPFEIHIIKAKSSSDTDELKKLLTRRLELLQYHNRFDEDFPVKQPEIYAEGNFVVLLSTNDNSSAVRLLKKLL